RLTRTTTGLRLRTVTSTPCGSPQTIFTVLKNTKDDLDGLSGSRHKNPSPLGKGYKFRQGLDLHFLHHPVAMGLDGALSRARDLLVLFAADDKFKNLPLARRQCSDMSADHVQLALQAARHFMVLNRPLDCLKKFIR